MLVRLDGSHRDLVHRIRDHAEEWLADKDTDQYRSGLDPTSVRQNLDRQIDAGQFYGWQDGGGHIVAVAALTEPDPDFWTPQERAEPQTYIGRLYVAEGAHGKGHGAAMLDAIVDYARERGHRWVRLNCWTTNARLHAYYQAQGFEHVRTSDVPGRMSGALFQRRTRDAKNGEFDAKGARGSRWFYSPARCPFVRAVLAPRQARTASASTPSPSAIRMPPGTA